MGEEKPELSEGKLSSQSGYSPIKQADHNEIEEEENTSSEAPKPKRNIPKLKKGE